MDRKEKKLRLEEWARGQRAAARTALPLSDEKFQALFDEVNEHLENEGCDRTRRFTEQWLSRNLIAVEPVLSWLEANGGYCDCEVIANAEEAWENFRGQSGRADA